MITYNKQKGVWSRWPAKKGIPGSFLKMHENIIKFDKIGENISRGDNMNPEQIILLIFNERLYNAGEITKDQKDKVEKEVKLGKYNEYC